MQTVITQTALPATAHSQQTFPPLDQETRSHVETACAAYHLMRKPQTMRAYACLESGPIRPVRINGLAWSVAEIKALLNGGQ
jgi:hypothetical protein